MNIRNHQIQAGRFDELSNYFYGWYVRRRANSGVS
jgi:hypothetical protein